MPSTSEASNPIEIFYAYAHEDEYLRKELEKHLSLLLRQGVIAGWHDRLISAGTEWAQQIDSHLNTAQIILLLISADFLASDYCYSIEMKHALERHKAGEASVIPVILRSVSWQLSPFGILQVLPTDGKPVESAHWHSRDEALTNIVEGLYAVIDKIHTQYFHYASPSQQMQHVSYQPDSSGSPETSGSQASKHINNLQEIRILLEYKSRLERIRVKLLYDVNFREIKPKDIDIWEQEIRAIVKGIEILRSGCDISDYLNSIAEFYAKLNKTKENLYLASDILEKRSTTRDRRTLYKTLNACPDILSDAIKQFRIEATEQFMA